MELSNASDSVVLLIVFIIIIIIATEINPDD